MEKHTPGPWKITEHNEFSYIVQDRKKGITICCAGGTKSFQVKANALLIAAAPEMLEALKAALYYIEEEVIEEQSTANTDMLEAKIKALIAKAEGR